MKHTLGNKSSKSSTAGVLRGESLILLITLLASAALSVACAKSGDGSKADSQATTFVLTLPEDKADETQATAELICNIKGTACPPAMAMMLTRTNSGRLATFKQCTSFLVAPDIMATNAHCLPEVLRTQDVSCKQVTFYFGATKNRKPERVSCAKVLTASVISEDPKSTLFLQQPDYAFLKLDRPLTRPPLELSRAGLAVGSQLKILAIDPENRNGHIRGILRLKTCGVTQSNYLNPREPGNFADVMSGACKIIHGNSGSPILDDDVKVRGILQGSWQTETIKRENFSGIQLAESFSDMSVFTNVACVQAIPGALTGTAHADCMRPHLTRDQLIERVTQGPANNFDLSFAAWNKSSPKLFEFNLSQASGTTGRSFPELTCIRKQDSAQSDLAAQASVTTDGDMVTARFKAPVFGRKTLISSDFRVSSINGVIETAEMSVTFDQASMRERAFAKTKVELNGQLTKFKTNVYDLPVCAD